MKFAHHGRRLTMLKLITLNAIIYTLLAYESNVYGMDKLTVLFVCVAMCFVVPMVLLEEK